MVNVSLDILCLPGRITRCEGSSMVVKTSLMHIDSFEA